MQYCVEVVPMDEHCDEVFFLSALDPLPISQPRSGQVGHWSAELGAYRLIAPRGLFRRGMIVVDPTKV